MALDRFDNDFERTVYGKVKDMTIDEFADFLFSLYRKAYNDGKEGVTDDFWVHGVYPYQIDLLPWETDE